MPPPHIRLPSFSLSSPAFSSPHRLKARRPVPPWPDAKSLSILPFVLFNRVDEPLAPALKLWANASHRILVSWFRVSSSSCSFANKGTYVRLQEPLQLTRHLGRHSYHDCL